MLKKCIRNFHKLVLFLLILEISAFSQESIQWLNYTNGDNINCLKLNEEHLWVGTNGGLVCINTLSGETKYYNRSNSGLPSNQIFALESGQPLAR